MHAHFEATIESPAIVDYTLWFVIDTNRYSGNFERDMAAFVTGRYGDCEVGKDVAERVLQQEGAALEWTAEAICSVADDEGFWRPVEIQQTPGWVQGSDGQHYRDGDLPGGIEISQQAYQSVAISFSRSLTFSELQQLMRRAEMFPQDVSYLRFFFDKPLEILGYRLYEERVEQHCLELYKPLHS